MTGDSRSVEDVKCLLQARIESLVRELCPDGMRGGKYWLARCPWRDDRNPGSFWVAITGVPGAWRDEATGEKGDVLNLIAKAKGIEFRQVMAWARDWLGLERVSDEALRHARAKVQQMQGFDQAREASILAANRKRAFAAWLAASPKLVGTPVEAYLATRGIVLSALPRPPRALRFAMRRHLETNTLYPCMLALMTGPDPAGVKESIPYAIHCTFLKVDGFGKANVSPARKMWPSYAGSAIRLSKGETGVRPAEAAKQGLLDRLVLCEGVEDGLSIALACPHLRVWAVGALGNLGKVSVPACCDEVIVAADNDWGKPQAAKLLAAGVDGLVAQGVRVSIARSHIGKDANDALRGGPLLAEPSPAMVGG